MTRAGKSAREAAIEAHVRSLPPPPHPLAMNLATLIVLAAPLMLAITGVLGGGPPKLVGSRNGEAALEVEAPRYIRSGMIGEIHVRATPVHGAAAPAIHIPDSWLRGITINQTSPQPVRERAVPGATRLEFAPIPPGATLDLSLSFQVNPDRHGKGGGTVRLFDGGKLLVSQPVGMRVLP